jgi:formate/nitrite transporter FocA (FNT family)
VDGFHSQRYRRKDFGHFLSDLVVHSIWFEHSVANMYYIPAGILAKANEGFVQAAISLGVKSDQIANLNWGTLFTKNLIPVTLGNIVGGALFVATIYWFVYLREGKAKGDKSIT